MKIVASDHSPYLLKSCAPVSFSLYKQLSPSIHGAAMVPLSCLGGYLRGAQAQFSVRRVLPAISRERQALVAKVKAVGCLAWLGGVGTAQPRRRRCGFDSEEVGTRSEAEAACDGLDVSL
jgi:hypothetical protein